MALYDIITKQLPRGFKHPREYIIENFVMAPPQWRKFPSDIKLQWNKTRFGPSFKSQVPKESGVYSFVISADIKIHPTACCLIYIGKTEKQTFRDRYGNYLQERKRLRRDDRVKVARYLSLCPEHTWFYYAPIKNQSTIDRVEQELLKALLPVMNEQFPAEVRDAVKILRG